MDLQESIRRWRDISAVQGLLREFPVVSILGPRQCGKTTLARTLSPNHWFDLENPRDEQALKNPQVVLENLRGVIAIDEVQRAPHLFPVLRHLADERNDRRFLLLGSASPHLIRQSSESLAGRVAFHRLSGFALDEVMAENWRKLWLRGGFPRSYLAQAEAASFRWRDNFIATFIERDLASLGIDFVPAKMRQFWMMISHYHGQLVNYADLGRSIALSETTLRRYLEILNGTFMISLLPAWSANVGKRLVKSPRIYVSDSGLFHSFRGLETIEQLFTHPYLGASFEGFVIGQAIRSIGLPHSSFYFYRTQAGTELDLFWQWGGRNWGLEVKFSDAPASSKSLVNAIGDLQLDKAFVVYPGERRFAVNDRTIAVPVSHLANPFVYD